MKTTLERFEPHLAPDSKSGCVLLLQNQRTACPRGHVYDETQGDRRSCRECRLQRSRDYRKRVKLRLASEPDNEGGEG
jgi:hypothetical protein